MNHKKLFVSLLRAIVPAAGLLLTGVGFTECEGPGVTLTVTTAPPPGGVAELDDDGRVLTLSRGSAVAITVTDGYANLQDLEVTTDDHAFVIASAVPNEGRFIVAGLAVGDTDLHLRWEDGGRYEIAVHVEHE